MLLDPGLDLNLRPMRYPQFYDMYLTSIKNTWTVDEVSFNEDLKDLRDKISSAEAHMIRRLVAFFATGDTIVSNNIALTLYKHINSPEARMYLSRQIAEEALHIQGYLTLLDTYVPDMSEREQAFKAVEQIPSITAKADFCDKWFAQVPDTLETDEDRSRFFKNLIAYCCGIEGLAFFAAFLYVFFMRNKGLLNGLADLTNYIFKDEASHLAFGLEVINIIKQEYPELWTDQLQDEIYLLINDAINCEIQFAEDVLSEGVTGLPSDDVKRYLQCVGDERLTDLGLKPAYNKTNPFDFMELQGLQNLSNFFERRVTNYQIGVSGDVDLTAEF